MPALSEKDQAELLIRVLECSSQSEGWPQVLDFIDRTLDCESYLAEFDEDGAPLPHFGGQHSARNFGTVLGQIETEGGRNALQFLLSEASLFYPYCKTSLARAAGSKAVLTSKAGASGETPGDAEDPPGHQERLRLAPGLIAPVWRTGHSTILFGCVFTAHQPDSIDVAVASETFRTIVKALAPGLNVYFEMEKERRNNQFQRLLLSAAERPALLLDADREILAHTPCGLEALEKTGTALERRHKLHVKNKQLDAALLELAVATRQHPDRQDVFSIPSPRRSLCLADPEGVLKRLCIRTVFGGAEKHGAPNTPMFLVRVSEPKEVSEEIEKCLQDHYDLSQSEAHLARHLTITGSMNMTVDDLGITRNTAKTHLRRIYEKTGVNTQLQLARLVHRLAQLY